MVDTIATIISGIARNPYGFGRMTEDEMKACWRSIGSFIRDKMEDGKGVNVPGLGTFSYTSQKVDLGNRYKVVNTPAFFLSEKFSRTHGVRCKKPNPSGNIPVVELSFIAVGSDCGMSRAEAQCVLKDVLVAVADYVHTNRACELEMGVGRLLFRGGQANMRWAASFVRKVEKTNTGAIASSRPMTASGRIRSGRAQARARPSSATVGGRRSVGDSFAEPATSARGNRSAPAPYQYDERGEGGSRPSTASSRRSSVGGSDNGAGVGGGYGSRGSSQRSSRRPSTAGSSRRGSIQGNAARDAAYTPLDVSGYGVRFGERPPSRQSSGRRGSSASSGRPPRSDAGSNASTPSEADVAYHSLPTHDSKLCNICKSKDLAARTKRALRAKEAEMDRKLHDFYLRDAELARQQQEEEEENRRQKAREVQAYNLALKTDRERQNMYTRQADRAVCEEPVMGARPDTPPAAIRAQEYHKVLEDQIKMKDARRARAIKEEVAYATVAQSILEREVAEEKAAAAARRRAAIQENAETLNAQMRLKELQREEERRRNNVVDWDATIQRSADVRESEREKMRRTREMHEQQLADLAAKRAADDAQKRADEEHEARELARIQAEVAEQNARDREASYNTRRDLEKAWDSQCRTKRAIATLEAPRGPQCTSLQLQCESDDYDRCIRCGRPMPDGMLTRNPTATSRRYKLTGF